MSLAIFACFFGVFADFYQNRQNGQKLAKGCRSFLLLQDLGRLRSLLSKSGHPRPLLKNGPKWVIFGLILAGRFSALQNLLKALGWFSLEPG